MTGTLMAHVRHLTGAAREHVRGTTAARQRDVSSMGTARLRRRTVAIVEAQGRDGRHPLGRLDIVGREPSLGA